MDSFRPSVLFISSLFVLVNSSPHGGLGDLPLQNPYLFEGDILGFNPSQDRNAIPDDVKRWPNNKIPFLFDPHSDFDDKKKEMIMEAMSKFELYTCLKFVQKKEMDDEHKNYILFFLGNGCYSHVGLKGGVQPLSLGSGCYQLSTIIHELNHAVGFFHEHTRSDRDEYINIHWSQIMDSAKDQFYKLNPWENRILEPYDYNSIMHYGERTFSKDGWTKTMTAKDKDIKLLDVYDKKGLTSSDIRRIHKLYECLTA